MSRMGLAGGIAKAFIDSKLTPLFIIASMLLGLGAVIFTPKEEEPQIKVPMADIFLPLPGAQVGEVEQRLASPAEKLMWEIPGVEYVYSTSSPGMALVVVRFFVGQDAERSLVKIWNKLEGSDQWLPSGAMPPLVRMRGIDDVPILGLTLWSDHYNAYELGRMAGQLDDEIRKIDKVAATEITGGLQRQIRVELDPVRLAAHGLSPAALIPALGKANQVVPAGSLVQGNREFVVEAGSFLRSADEIRELIVGFSSGKAVRLGDVAEVEDTSAEPESLVFFLAGPAAHDKGIDAAPGRQFSAVTISVAKRRGSNATKMAEQVLEHVEEVRPYLLPADVKVTVTRNYGETAREKTNELIKHLLIATFSVILLIAFALGFRESLVVGVAVPVTLALTLLIYYLAGYTLNRVTLFALIFSIGILVDDAIVVVENIHRHFTITKLPALQTAIHAVNEVGNPTILATFAVIAAILPMAFVRGLMGPYMRPIPVGASMAMLFSLFIAFMISPWLSLRVLKKSGHGPAKTRKEDWLTRLYRAFMGKLIHSPGIRWLFLAFVVLLLLAAMSLVYFKLVKVKMLPFDNKSEFQVIIDMPEGTTLERSARVARELAVEVSRLEEVTDLQIYAGASAPFNFNGLVRHYYLRRGGNVADIQVNLVGKRSRDRQSHDIAKAIRPALAAIGREHDARIKVVEIPPGPPVLSTLVAEIYGPDAPSRLGLARQVLDVFEGTHGVVDVDWYLEDPQPKLEITVDRDRAAAAGLDASLISQSLRIALHGVRAGSLQDPNEKQDVPILLRLKRESRSDVATLTSLHLGGPAGKALPVSDLIEISRTEQEPNRYHKNLKPVIYIVGDVAGTEESPVYAILKMEKQLDTLRSAQGRPIKRYVSRAPRDESALAIKWDGEWQITVDVFRDLGLAFAAVLVLIYVLVVGWFKSFSVPLVIMAPIPLTLVGILPGHAAFGAFFTATSMIGFIAGAGIIVRNSIILVDFANLRMKEGMPLDEAIIDAGAIRFRPMLLTAAAVVVGSFVILFDPIFQGLALALMFGEVASTLLSRITVPILFYMSQKRHAMQGPLGRGGERAPTPSGQGG